MDFLVLRLHLWLLMIWILWLILTHVRVGYLLVSPGTGHLMLLGLGLSLLATPGLALRGYLLLLRSHWWLVLDKDEELLSHLSQVAELAIPLLDVLEVQHVLVTDIVKSLHNFHAELEVEVDLWGSHGIVGGQNKFHRVLHTHRRHWDWTLEDKEIVRWFSREL